MPHHLTQRGNRREEIFFAPADRDKYAALMRDCSLRHGLTILAYCWMTNHVHLVAVPASAYSLAKTLRDAHTAYALYVNRREHLSGHLWQGRFFSCVLDEWHLQAAVRYVERNPVRAGLAKRAEDWPWSSAAAHCGLRSDALLSGPLPWADEVADWSGWLAEPDDGQAGAIRSATHTGRPCGSAKFIQGLENTLGRILRPAKRGRKPKSKLPPAESAKGGLYANS
jgi:putative transposase